MLKPREFRVVYDKGKRFDGRLMTVFMMPTSGDVNRLGVTASKKISTKAHDRNRCKRLLREAFRLSKVEMQAWSRKYDLVINARRSLLKVRLGAVSTEFRSVIGKVLEFESQEGERTSE